MKYNEKMTKIRENNGKTEFVPEGLTEEEIGRAMYLYGMLLGEGPMEVKWMADRTGWTKAMMFDACQAMLAMGLATRTQLQNKLGKPYKYTAAQNARLPDGWTKERCTGMENPYTPTEAQAKRAEAKAERIERGKENALTRALAKADLSIPEDSLGTYQRFVSDLSKLKYGVKELDDIIDDAIGLARDRCQHVDRQCPVCHGRLKASGTAAVCMSKRCGMTFDSKKSFELSVRGLRAFAEMKA